MGYLEASLCWQFLEMEVGSGGFTSRFLVELEAQRAIINMIGRWKWRTGFGWYKTEELFSWAGPPESFMVLPVAVDQMDRKFSLNNATQIWQLKFKIMLMKDWESSNTMDIIKPKL